MNRSTAVSNRCAAAIVMGVAGFQAIAREIEQHPNPWTIGLGVLASLAIICPIGLAIRAQPIRDQHGAVETKSK